ncbi:MAG: hypothetical protein IKB97_03160 [Bacteroidaceae bacterium]|nr:hypothetical protein [Bacteroidaceae bacterium]
MKFLKIFAALLLGVCFALPQKAAAENSETIYVLGYGISFKDSVAYFTGIQEIKQADLQKKTGFLTYRSDFSDQLKTYLQTQLGVPNPTCAIFFSEKKSAIEKKVLRLRRQINYEKERRIQEIPLSEFVFFQPTPTNTPQE